MLKGLLYFVAFALFSVNSISSFANNNVRQNINIESTAFEYISNDSRLYSIEQVQRLTKSQWIQAQDFTPYGLINRHYWLHLQIEVDTSKSDPLYLEIANPLLDQLDVYFFQGSQSHHYVAGDLVDTNKRPIATPTLYFPLPHSNNTTLDIYINYRNDAASYMPLAITNSKESFESVGAHGIFIGVIIGLILMLVLGTLVLYKQERTPLLQYFFGFLLFGSITVLALEGVASIYLWPSMPWLQNLLFPPLLLLTLWCSIDLTRLLISKHIASYPTIAKTLLWVSRIVILAAPILFALPSFIAIIVSIAFLYLALIIVTVTLIIFTIKSRIVLPWLLTCWAVFTLSLTIKIVHFSGLSILPNSLITIATIGYCLQFILWGGIILQRYIHDKETTLTLKTKLLVESETKNVEADEQLSENHQEHLNLEALVNERTFELNVTLRELQETNRQLEEQATNDALTGVKNRKFFDQRLQAEYRLSRRQHTPISLLLLDADKFKNVNDTYGHLAGDKVLIAISKIASQVLKRHNDYVCRYGGEEFAILLSNTDEKGAIKVAEIIRQTIADTTISADTHKLSVSVSIGVSSLMINSDTVDDQLFGQADKALYHAKESGRNNVKSYHEFKLSTK